MTTVTNTNPIGLPSSLEFERAVSAPDPDGSTVPSYPAGPGAGAVRVGAICDTPSRSITLRVYLLGSQGQVLAANEVLLISGPSPDFGVLYTGQAACDACWPLGGAKAAAVKVDALTGGDWTIYGAMG